VATWCRCAPDRLVHHRTLVAIVALLASAAARGAEPLRPIPWLDPSALMKPFLQLAFEAPETVRPGTLELSLRTFYSSTILRGWGSTLMVNVNVETAQPTAVIRYGVADGTELQLVVPGAIDYEGWLTRPIKFVEGTVANVNRLRVGAPPRQGRIQIQDYRRGTGLDWVGDGGTIGDLSLGVKTLVGRQDGVKPAVSIRAALGLPTGRFPDGTGQPALAGGATAGWTLGSTAIWLEADGELPSATFSSMELRTRPHGALQLGVAQRIGSAISLHVQTSTHSAALAPFGISDVDGRTSYLLAGLTATPTRALSVAFALVENIFTTARGADISAVLELTWRP
jgi:hypothetical protein